MSYRLFKKAGKRGTSGNVAIEFALIAPVFFLLFFAILETSLATFASMILENGMKNVARLVRTGQAQNQALTAEQFRQQLCNQVQLVLSCDVAKLYIDVRAFNSFAGSAFPPPVDAQGNLIPGNVSTYQPGASSQLSTQNSIVLVRAFYTWQMFTPLLGQYYANMPNNIRLLTASAAFRNEPF